MRSVLLLDPGGAGWATSFYTSVKKSAVLHPERIVAVTDAGGKDVITASLVGSIINAPDAFISQKSVYGYADAGWGLNCPNYFSTASHNVKTGRWGDTDGFAPRYLKAAHVALADGHVEAIRTVAEMAAGTNWHPNINCRDVRVTDYEFYRWDPRFDDGPQR